MLNDSISERLARLETSNRRLKRVLAAIGLAAGTALLLGARFARQEIGLFNHLVCEELAVGDPRTGNFVLIRADKDQASISLFTKSKDERAAIVLNDNEVAFDISGNRGAAIGFSVTDHAESGSDVTDGEVRIEMMPAGAKTPRVFINSRNGDDPVSGMIVRGPTSANVLIGAGTKKAVVQQHPANE